MKKITKKNMKNITGKKGAKMKILYSWGGNKKFVNAEIKEWNKIGHDVTSLNHREEVGVDYWTHFEIFKRLKNYERDPDLLRLYNKVRELAKNHDVLMVPYENPYHPSFIKSLTNIYTVIVSGDDPESSEFCSKPYVNAFDHSFTWGVNWDKNIKTKQKFLEWGAKRADWWPYGVREDWYDPSLKEEDIISKERDIDLVYAGSALLNLKIERIIKLKKAFPQMKLFGRDYKKTFGINCYHELRQGNYFEFLNKITTNFWGVREVAEDRLTQIYQDTKIGVNIHLSYGPCNRRMFHLPANGIMQICDCPEGLGEVFKIGKEVVVYHSIEEAIELVKYYLEHEEERKKIAVAGYKRVMKDYKRTITFSSAISKIKKGMVEDGIKHFKDGNPILIK